MQPLPLLANFFGGLFLANSIPHLINGMSGRPFQTPFAKPPGEGLSTSTVNVLWALLNLAIAWLLLIRVGNFDVHSLPNLVAAALGAFPISLFLARHFGKFHGGNNPQ